MKKLSILFSTLVLSGCMLSNTQGNSNQARDEFLREVIKIEYEGKYCHKTLSDSKNELFFKNEFKKIEQVAKNYSDHILKMSQDERSRLNATFFLNVYAHMYAMNLPSSLTPQQKLEYIDTHMGNNPDLKKTKSPEQSQNIIFKKYFNKKFCLDNYANTSKLRDVLNQGLVEHNKSYLVVQ